MAYYDLELIIVVKVFIVHALGVNFIQDFSSSLMAWQNKLECLSLVSFFGLV